MTPDEYAQNELDKQRRIGPVNDSFVWTSPNGVDHHAYCNRPCATCGRVHLPDRSAAAQQARDLVQVIGLTYTEYDDLKFLARTLPPTSPEPKGDDLV